MSVDVEAMTRLAACQAKLEALGGGDDDPLRAHGNRDYLRRRVVGRVGQR
jgi:hypothetical protein